MDENYGRYVMANAERKLEERVFAVRQRGSSQNTIIIIALDNQQHFSFNSSPHLHVIIHTDITRSLKEGDSTVLLYNFIQTLSS